MVRITRIGQGQLRFVSLHENGLAIPKNAPGTAYPQEWLEVDGLGGFASCTTLGIPTRRYHGLLFLSRNGPNDRYLAVCTMHDWAYTDSGRYELSSAVYRGEVHPDGIRRLWRFQGRPFPRYWWNLEGIFLSKEIFMKKGVPGVYVRYSVEGGPVRIEARPLINHREYHHVSRAGSWSPDITKVAQGMVVQGHPACKLLAMMTDSGEFRKEPVWYYGMSYPQEEARGLDAVEDHLSPGEFCFEVACGKPVSLWAGPVDSDLCPDDMARCLGQRYEEARRDEVRRRSLVAQREYRREPGRTGVPPRYSRGILGDLALAADQFVVEAGGSTSIIAGYHWFGEWGRDSFIALPGVLLAVRRFGEARQVFRRFAESISNGLIPNRFEEGGGRAYNCVDASLWMIKALGEYEKSSGDKEFVLSMLPLVEDIISAYSSSAAPCVFMKSSGLLSAGGPETQMTWMDAKVHGNPATSRHGCPVEVNALWVHALLLSARWRILAGGQDGGRLAIARKVKRSFLQAFSWPGYGLYDRLDHSGPVKEIRPNQLIAAGVSDLGLSKKTCLDMWNSVAGSLLTPKGIRTLDPRSFSYRGTYRGSPSERDGAYHQGTAWPWLVGPFHDLAIRLDSLCFGGERKPFSAFVVRQAFPGIVSLTDNPCYGSVFEVASGDWPYEPGGAVAQAWSVGEVSRILSQRQKGRR